LIKQRTNHKLTRISSNFKSFEISGEEWQLG